MSATSLKSIASGAIFGAAITAAGVYSPPVIIGQMNLTDFHMLKAFIAASASSALAIILTRKLNFTTCKPRTPSSIGWFSTYDGNILGGLLLGAGMTLTGACPGTLLPQIATGVRSGALVLLGATIGGILYSKFGRALKVQIRDKDAMEKPTVYQKYDVQERDAILLYEGMCAAILASATYFAPGDGMVLLPPIVGGLLIGGSQAANLVLTGNLLGASQVYEQIGDVFWWALSTREKTAMPSIKATAFAAGTMLGGWGLSQMFDIPVPADVEIGAARAVVGGAVMLFGSRIAGGCTSGHGISGMSLLSMSSVITVASIFAGGMGLAAVLG